jgi:hypothetical protein
LAIAVIGSTADVVEEGASVEKTRGVECNERTATTRMISFAQNCTNELDEARLEDQPAVVSLSTSLQYLLRRIKLEVVVVLQAAKACTGIFEDTQGHD